MTKLFAIAAAVSLTLPIPVAAEKADSLERINGMDAGRAEAALRSRGFTYIASNTNSMRYTYSYWWKDQDRNCIRIEAHNGIIETVSDANAGDCHHGGGGDAAAAIGIVAGAAILGALLSHKSNHHENGQHYQDAQSEQYYERGYNDGLYNAAYHNYDRNDAYANGYSAGVDQRNANLSNHSGRGGYVRAAQYADLAGARGSSGMDELSRRGFRQVDNFASGDTRYSIQWQPQTRQCVQVTIADGRFYDVSDIGQHPRCR